MRARAYRKFIPTSTVSHAVVSQLRSNDFARDNFMHEIVMRRARENSLVVWPYAFVLHARSKCVVACQRPTVGPAGNTCMHLLQTCQRVLRPRAICRGISPVRPCQPLYTRLHIEMHDLTLM